MTKKTILRTGLQLIEYLCTSYINIRKETKIDKLQICKLCLYI